MSNIRHNSLWQIETFKQRMTYEEWKQLLLDKDDRLIYQGVLTQLVARDLGYGVVEVSKAVE